jgi:hypothetical protein
MLMQVDNPESYVDLPGLSTVEGYGNRQEEA